ncbi:MAG: flippase [Nitrospirota bacterium]
MMLNPLRQQAPIQQDQSSSLVRVAHGSALIFISTFFGLGLNFLHSIVLARALNAERFGLYALGLATFNVLSVISVAGLDRAILRFVPAVSLHSQTPPARSVVKIITGISAGIGGVIGLGLLALSSSLSMQVFHKIELTPVLILFSFAIPLFAISTILLSTLQALQDVRWRVFVKYGCEPVIKFATTVALLWMGWDVFGALIAFIIALCVTVVLAVIPLYRHFLPCSPSFSHKENTAEVIRYSIPLLGSLVFASLSNRSDILVLGYWVPTESIGIYSAAFQTASIIALILGSLDSVATPFISQAIATGNQPYLQRLLRTVLRWSVTISLPVFLVMAFFPREILSIFGDRFAEGALCLVILAISQMVNAVSGSASNVLLLAGYSRLAMWNSISMGLIQIGFNVTLIPLYGITGAAIGTAAAFILLSIVRLLECSMLLKLTLINGTIWKPLFAGFISSILLLALNSSNLSMGLAVMLAALFATYFLCLTLLGLDGDDQFILIQLKDKMRRYVGVKL